MLYMGATIGGAIGSYLPILLFHSDGLSAASIFGGIVGGVLGIWAAIKLANNY
jgi:hypothetical protein